MERLDHQLSTYHMGPINEDRYGELYEQPSSLILSLPLEIREHIWSLCFDYRVASVIWEYDHYNTWRYATDYDWRLDARPG